MWIATRFLLLTFTVFLNSIELVCSEPRTLEDLFPGFSGVMPPIEELKFFGRRYELFWSSRQIRNFEKFDDKNILRVDPYRFSRRAHIIVGWDSGVRQIVNLFNLFSYLPNAYIIFDMIQDKWLTVPQDLAHKLGVGRRYSLVVARDKVAAKHVSTSNDPVYKEAHIRACRQANVRGDIVEKEQVQLIEANRTNNVDSSFAIHEEYSREYDRAFALYLYRHGEFNMNGHRMKHPLNEY